MKRIYDVSDVAVWLSAAAPPELGIHATGRVVSLGWSSPALLPWRYVAAPEDGIQDFDFVAEEPLSRVGAQLVTVVGELHTTLDTANFWGEGRALTGVRVHGQFGSVTRRFDEANALSEATATWPW